MGQGDQIVISVSVGSLLAGLNEASAAFDAFGRDARADVDGVNEALQAATTETKSFGQAFEEAASEKGGQWLGRLITELQEVVPVSGTAKVALGELAKALSGGWGVDTAIGLVIGAVKVLVSAFQELETPALKEAKERAEKAAEAYKKLAEEMVKNKVLAGMSPVEAAAYLEREKHEDVIALKRNEVASREGELQKFLQEVVQRGEKVGRTEQETLEFLKQGNGQLQQWYAVLQANVLQAQEELRATQGLVNARAALARIEKEEKDREKRKRTTKRDENADFRAAEAEFSLAAHQATHGVDLSTSQGGVFNLQESERRAAREEQERAQRQANLHKYGGYGAGYDKEAAASAKRMLEAQQEEQARLEALAGKWQSYGEKVGGVLAGIAQGTKSWGDLTKMLLQDVLSQMYQYAIKRIMMSAGVAGGEAASSQAGIPYVGPILAVAAMGAIYAAVSALIGSIGSAAGGAVIPHGVNPVMQVHSGEHIIPERIARRYEQGAPGGGVTLQIQALDPRQGVGYLRANRRQIARDLRGLARNNALGPGGLA